MERAYVGITYFVKSITRRYLRESGFYCHDKPPYNWSDLFSHTGIQHTTPDLREAQEFHTRQEAIDNIPTEGNWGIVCMTAQEYQNAVRINNNEIGAI